MDAARVEFRRGLLESVPVVLGIMPIGFLFGALARAAGLTWVEAGLMSAVVYAGPSQLVAVGLLQLGAGFSLIVLTTLIVNLRYVLYAASLAPYFRDRSPGWLALIAYGLVDGAYAVSIAHCVKSPRQPRKDAYYLAVTVFIYVTWVPASFLGGYLIEALPEIRGLGLEFLAPAMYIALLIPLLRDATEALSAILAIPATMAMVSVLPYAQGVLVAIAIIALLGGFFKWLRFHRSS